MHSVLSLPFVCFHFVESVEPALCNTLKGEGWEDPPVWKTAAHSPSHLQQEERPSDLGIRASSQADLIKYRHGNTALVRDLFNYLESNTFPHVHFPDDKVEKSRFMK